MDADDPVLVVLLNRPRDLEIARSEHWYRIPAKRAPAHAVHARYLAFYLTKAFEEERWSIREYAYVRGHELVRRQDLFPGDQDHPRAKELYIKLQLSPLIRLPRPIVSLRGRRILFLWTNGLRFSRAVELNDLLGKSDADDALWDALKCAGIEAQRQVTVRDRQARYRIDYWVPCAHGNLAVLLGDSTVRLPRSLHWRVLRFSEEEIIARLDRCVEQVLKTVNEMGDADYTTELPHEHSH